MAVPELYISAKVVDEALNQAETLLKSHDSYSAIDRMHTALHGYMLHLCKEEGIVFNEKRPKLQDVYSKLRQEHPAFKNSLANTAYVNQMLKVIAKLLENLNEIRNQKSMAHPNEEFLSETEALFVINSARSILQYIDGTVRDMKVLK